MPESAQREPTLSMAHVGRLRNDPSPAARAETAAGVADMVAAGNLTEGERQTALEVLELLAHDVAQQVREALAAHLVNCHLLPAEIARTLAEDIETVALPILQFSEALRDEDLIAVVRAGNVNKQEAVAGRKSVSSAIAEALVDTENPSVVRVLLDNPGADIAEQSLHKVMDTVGEDEAIQASMVARATLPLTLKERLISCVSEQLREYIIAHHGFSRELAEQLALQGRERAVAEAAAAGADPGDMDALAVQLHAEGKLTASIVLRALCNGDLRFFESSMAQLAGLSIDAVRSRAYDTERGGLRTIYTQSGLPRELYRAFRVVIEIVSDVVGEDRRRPGDLTQRIVLALVRTYPQVSPSDIETVLSDLYRCVVARAR